MPQEKKPPEIYFKEFLSETLKSEAEIKAE